jgi:bZIP transcription factor/Minimal binding motif of Hap4 for binding to Hap2/3/5
MATSPVPQTPTTSADSPLPFTAGPTPIPSLAMKPSPGPLSPAVSSPVGIVTQKEWVIPPRPKPGRKPAVDTPPTKRKAQNRAAQRAFRERRAARVGELEERIKEIEEEDAVKSKEMETQIRRLQHDVERFKDEVVAWKERCKVLDRDLEQARKEKERVSRAYDELRESYEGGPGNAVPLPARQGQRRDRTSNMHLQRDFHAPREEEIEPVGCGKCTKDTHCECVAQAINITNLALSTDNLTNASKRPHSPPTTSSSDTIKRLRNTNPTDLETDFTALYSSNKRKANSNVSSVADPDVATTAGGNTNAVLASLAAEEIDSCGFCQDGTPCICADISLAISSDNNRPNQIPPLPQFTPPPSDTDVTLPPLSSKPQLVLPPLQSTTATAASCVNGPGTCSQCRTDPNSTLFCKSLAAIQNNKTGATLSSSSCCCGGSAANGGTCCRDPTSNNGAVMLSCADTYQTLSRHPGYKQATDEFGSWLNRLNASSTAAAVAGRPAMEVEAASVMEVLKLFDRRFGRG